ncbi:MAG: DNA polymerase III subunit gamma/tau [Candidatus Shapirobacteria bacterium]|nr:DNA polymerase III subunit gamma/tau [Candidatus Shapirobacteria bacterium]MDD5073804.1 DNA polymerase III subunit gamma/tau [Candidatus Shapirobacteria bacterium]MDD5481511.1 DNA polymerase III subunit gamma/tau [Candidatus Shapirobacteria bacterium]
MAFYIKYRPKKVAEIDLTEARESLGRILSSDPFPHALLLAGPRGIGKTSVARIIAKSLNCQEKKPGQADPCNHCSSCSAINKGAFLDVLEIDAASNRGIDDIRQLKEGVGLAPVRGKTKVYIIDEVHMLTNEAFNALLKTLEEPPPQVVFILCTTNPEKIPQTVLSRCLRINFHKASDQEVLRALKRVVKKENLKIESDQVLKIIAHNVDGSFRDGQKILEELSFTNSTITVFLTKKVIGDQSTFQPERILSFISNGDLSMALEEVARLDSGGVDWLSYLKGLLVFLRRLLHGVWGISDGQEGNFSAEQLMTWVEIFSQAANKARKSDLPILVMELAVAQAIGVNKDNSNYQRSGEEKGGRVKHEPAQDHPKEKISKVEEKKNTNTRKKQKTKNSPKTINEEQWRFLLKKIKPKNHSLEAFLKAAYPVSFENNRLTLGVYYQFHKECLEKEVNRRIVESVASEIFDCPVSLFYCLVEKRPLVLKNNKNNPVFSRSKDDNIYNVAKKIFGGDQE